MSQTRTQAVTRTTLPGTRIAFGPRSSGVLTAAILFGLSFAWLVPIERSLGMFTATQTNISTLSSGTLEPPVTLLANVTGPGAIRLDWPSSPSAFATGYAIYRLDPGETDYLPIATVIGYAATTYTDGGLAPLSLYVYRVEAISGDWTSAPSSTAWAVTP